MFAFAFAFALSEWTLTLSLDRIQSWSRPVTGRAYVLYEHFVCSKQTCQLMRTISALFYHSWYFQLLRTMQFKTVKPYSLWSDPVHNNRYSTAMKWHRHHELIWDGGHRNRLTATGEWVFYPFLGDIAIDVEALQSQSVNVNQPLWVFYALRWSAHLLLLFFSCSLALVVSRWYYKYTVHCSFFIYW